MKNSKTIITLLSYSVIFSFIIFLVSCSNDTPINQGEVTYYDLKAWDYSESHYFLDTIYKASFLDYYNNETVSSQTNNLSVDDQSFEVWVQTDVSAQYYRVAALYTDLDSITHDGGYDDSLKSIITPVQGEKAFGIVRRLQQGEYVLNKYAGYVSLKIDLPDNYFAGVAYKRTATGTQYGTISTNPSFAPNDTLILKMIKVQNLVPQNTLAWELKLKNIYQLPKTNINSNGFEFSIRYLVNGVYRLTLPVNDLDVTLSTMLGLDRYTTGRTGSPDNKFDFITGYTIDPDNGWIIFPSLKPFVDNLNDYNHNGVRIDPIYWYPEIYDQLKETAKLQLNANNYILTGYTL